MTDHKFTEEQIIEALEIRMPHDAVCREAYDLINRQKAEIERLNTVHADMTESLRLAAEANKDMQAEIERLIKANNRDDLQHKYCDLIGDVLVYSKSLEDYNKFRKSFKSEAVKKFAENLTSKLNCIPQHHFTLAAVLFDLDKLVKEMTE